ncbi:peroxiredoxin [Sulfitobacter sp. SK011]|uniref:peroxiredoxin n=1 Tax=Sulfitobacter sp. SK011 TaxID=1389004 RepID=UPI000E0AD1C1|nr:peroxiredoxin [Sulfitobacter sp. SK011]AXI44005.1 peroxiredoxin [Sulfitobacter sp. SK011]
MTQALVGQHLPDVTLLPSDGRDVAMSGLVGLTVIYIYPRTSPPDGNAIAGWSDIPGAKGCTPQSCGFRDHHAELTDAGVAQVFGLSTQTSTYQAEVIERHRLPFVLLSDADLKLKNALNLPFFEAANMTLQHHLTLIVQDGKIEHLFENITDPAANAAAVLDYIKGR